MMERNHNGLTDKEQMTITFLIGKGFNDASIDGLSWEINIKDEKYRQDIVNMILEGFTSGINPSWELILLEQQSPVLMTD